MADKQEEDIKEDAYELKMARHTLIIFLGLWSCVLHQNFEEKKDFMLE